MNQVTLENALREAVQRHTDNEQKTCDQLKAKLKVQMDKKEKCAQRVAVIDQSLSEMKPRIAEAIGGAAENLGLLGAERNKLQEERELLLEGINEFDDIILLINKEILEANAPKQQKAGGAIMEQQLILSAKLNAQLADIEKSVIEWKNALKTVGVETEMYLYFSSFVHPHLKNNFLADILWKNLCI
jgi:hypothetical protein